jgi:hypothetical protein
MTSVENDVTGKFKVPKSKRILAFDLIRGFFLLVIIIDHIELYPNGWDLVTGKGRLWVSAAEGFFFMSGLLIGTLYRRRLSLGMKFIFKKMWARALELYLVGVALTFLFLAWAIFSGHAGIKDMPQPFDWGHYSVQTLLMRYTFGWADFLVRFAILMFFAPFVFWLTAKRLWWLAAAGILTAWLFRGQNFTLSWQLIFYGAIIIGYYWQDLEIWFGSLKAKTRSIIKRSFAVAAATTFIISYASVFVLSLLFHLWGDSLLAPRLQHVAYDWGNWNHTIWVYADKWTMGPIRVLLFAIWFPVLYWTVRRYENQINDYTKGVLEILGRNSLFVYTVHAFIVLAFKLYVIPPQTSFIENFLITTSAVILLILITYGYTRVQPKLKNINLSRNKGSLPKLLAELKR